MTLEKCKLVKLPKIYDSRGNLSFIEGNNHIPFSIARIYYLYDVPSGSERGGHAHKNLQQLIIPISGAFSIELDDGHSTKTFHLINPCEGLYIPRLIWRVLSNFSSNAVCLVLASECYSEPDYYRDYDQFVKAATMKNK